MLEFVIFDADGVLFDSTKSNIAYYNAVFAAMGEAPLNSDEEIASVSMASEQLFQARSRGDRDKVARMHEIGSSLDCTAIFAMLKRHVEPRPFMLGLKQRYRIALATNRSDTVPALIRYLDLDGVFDAVACTREPGVRPKPAPDILQSCLKRVGVSPQAAVYVGDSEIDMTAAEAAGTHFISVGSRIHAPIHIASVAELPSVLQIRFK